MTPEDFLALIHEFGDACQEAVRNDDAEEHAQVLSNRICAEIRRLHAEIAALEDNQRRGRPLVDLVERFDIPDLAAEIDRKEMAALQALFVRS